MSKRSPPPPSPSTAHPARISHRPAAHASSNSVKGALALGGMLGKGCTLGGRCDPMPVDHERQMAPSNSTSRIADSESPGPLSGLRTPARGCGFFSDQRACARPGVHLRCARAYGFLGAPAPLVGCGMMDGHGRTMRVAGECAVLASDFLRTWTGTPFRCAGTRISGRRFALFSIFCW
ncbi:hypothetical protein GY45DRAFT_1326488 [Cubamyces sp. BRFM 1775]|nr:hypothetical protein GY45DRAFT_1326488 [Cubamyces sp. BRFM 1775]